jgi:hypothetical protein
LGKAGILLMRMSSYRLSWEISLEYTPLIWSRYITSKQRVALWKVLYGAFRLPAQKVVDILDLKFRKKEIKRTVWAALRSSVLNAESKAKAGVDPPRIVKVRSRSYYPCDHFHVFHASFFQF